MTPPEKKRVGRPPGPISEKRVRDAIAILKRADMPGHEIARHFVDDPTPDDLLEGLKANGYCPPETTLEDLQGRSRVIRVEIAPLEDGVNPIETLIYIPDLLRDCVKELAGIKKQLRAIMGKEGR